MSTQAVSQQIARPTLLRDALRADAVFSAVAGITMVVGAERLAPILGQFAPVALVAVGVSLLLWAAILLYLASQQPVSRSAAIAVGALNILWVLGSVAGLLAGWFPLTRAGTVFELLQADIVATFAVLQLYAVLVGRKR